MRRAGTAARAPVALLAVAWVARAVAAENTFSSLGELLPPFISENLDELVKVGSATCEALPLDILFSRSYTLELPQTDIVEFTRASSRNYRVSKAHQRLRDAPTSSALVLYIPGWWNTPDDESTTALVNALLTKHPVVLVLDTRLSFCRGYVSSATRVKPLSHLLYSFIKNLYRDGFPVSSIHLIGFSLGAHVAGLTGKLVQKELKKKLGRITALDPAKPCFARSEYRLDKRDAKFVQIIHSSVGVLGLEDPLGHADIYVNGVNGRHPECEGKSISLECDHAQAWKMYSASITDDRAFMGRQCASWDELVEGACTGNQTVLGYSCSTTMRGMFLYKSKDVKDRTEPKVRVFNPLDFLTKW